MMQFYVTYHMTNGQDIPGGNFPAPDADTAMGLASLPWAGVREKEPLIKIHQSAQKALAVSKVHIVSVSVSTKAAE